MPGPIVFCTFVACPEEKNGYHRTNKACRKKMNAHRLPLTLCRHNKSANSQKPHKSAEQMGTECAKRVESFPRVDSPICCPIGQKKARKSQKPQTQNPNICMHYAMRTCHNVSSHKNGSNATEMQYKKKRATQHTKPQHDQTQHNKTQDTVAQRLLL
jgi:hypothetical protein